MAEFTTYAHGTPCWTDATSTDMDASLAFYEGLFGWEAETDPRPEANGYTTFRLRGKAVAGVSTPPPGGPQSAYWTTYLASDDVDATAAKIEEAGGTLLMRPFDVMDAGRMAYAQDPTGAAFGVWKGKEHIGAQLANEPGTLDWNECHSPDPARAASFYADVFGLQVGEQEMGGSEPYRTLAIDGHGVGGVAPTRDGEPPNWLTVFAVADCDESAARTTELGGSVLAEPFDIPGVGRFAVVQDPVGAVFGVIQLAEQG